MFKALSEGDLFLFKLHSPRDYIVGGGFFVKFAFLPSSLAWEAFGIANGANSLFELNQRIYKYKKTNHFSDPDPQIGSIILSMPFYFEENDWIPIPKSWNRNIVQGKIYDTLSNEGSLLFDQVQSILKRNGIRESLIQEVSQNRYGKVQLIKPRIGQGTFKIMVTDAYQRRCAITGEKTLPVLEAAHIKPYNLDGPHDIRNGLLLRRDFHTLFDRGYITIDNKLRIRVSQRIKEDFGNGKEYYAHQGQELLILPGSSELYPDTQFLEWHNDNIFLG